MRIADAWTRMRTVGACVAACVLAGTVGVAAASTPSVPRSDAVHAHGIPGNLSGTIVAIEGSDFTIQTNGRPTGMIAALTDAADAVTRDDTPYVWGGGHGEAGVASRGDIGGPGANGKNLGFDCSGAVAAVLAAAGLWPAGSFVPNDAGVIARLLADGVIAPGAGTAPDEVTLYDHPGVHIFMNIDGRFWGTSDGGAGGDAKGGAGWLDDGASDARSRAFRQYHIAPAILKDRTTYGQEYTFQLSADPGLVDGFLIGDHVTVGYRAAAGSMTASGLNWIGARKLVGTVTSLGDNGTGFVVQTRTGHNFSLDGTAVAGTLGALQEGDMVQTVYLRNGGTLAARVLTVTAVPTAQTASGTISAIAADQSSLTVNTAQGRRLKLRTDGDAAMLTGLAVGGEVAVEYSQWPNGTLHATTISPVETNSPPTVTGTTPAPTTTTPATTTPTTATPTTTTPTTTTPTSTASGTGTTAAHPAT